MTTATQTYKIKGIISAERPCDCCGNTQLEKSVVLETEDGQLLHVGTTCAGQMLLGNKSAKNGKTIEAEAKAHNYAEKWIGIHGDSEAVLWKIADAIRVHFCNATVRSGKILIGQEVK